MRISQDELLVVYDSAFCISCVSAFRPTSPLLALGCFITKHGLPSRQAGYIKWEAPATSFTHRSNFIILFSPSFIEIRDVTSGRIVQAIEGTNIRLLHSDPGPPDITHPQDRYNVIVAMKGTMDDRNGTSEKIVELVETSELRRGPDGGAGQPEMPVPAMWDEWDM
jgi:RHO1 GDP-GTP exchange protein 1/2